MNISTRPQRGRRIALVGSMVLALGLAVAAVALGAESSPVITKTEPYASALESESPPIATTEPYAVVPLSPSKMPVSAEALWVATLDTLECMEQKGVLTHGPYPSADGARVSYTYVVSEGAADIEIECGRDRESQAMRFAVDSDDAEAQKLVALRAALEQCVTANGVQLDTSEAAAAGPDIAIQKAAADSQGVVRHCAQTLAP